MDTSKIHALLLISCYFEIGASVKFIFNCSDTRSSIGRPTTVHRLRPADIEVVGAMGDSVTAGFGMKSTSVMNLFFEWRGLVFSIGGDGSLDGGISTIPNILKKFNPDIYGYSTGFGLFGFPPADKKFNVALTGAESDDALRQARDLVDTMKSGMGRFFNLQWKLVTIFLGQNDHCGHCDQNVTVDEFVKRYEIQMMQGLDYLHENLPRALVQVLGIVNPVKFFQNPSIARNPVCNAVHDFTCSCITNDNHRLRSILVHDGINAALDRLASKGRYDTRPDFTVVYQPMLSETDLPRKANSDEYDLSYMGHDCFHPNNKLHNVYSARLWKAMLTPVGQKTTYDIVPREEITIMCPTQQNPYISTNLNSHS